MLASVLHKFEQNRNYPGSPKLTFFSELTNKEIKNVICFHSFIDILDTNIFQLHVVHSGSAYTHLLVN